MMKILLHELEKAKGQALPLEGFVDVGSVRLDGTETLTDVRFSGECHKEADLVIVTGTITGLVQAKCAKCLIPTEYSLNVSFDEKFSEVPVDEESDIHFFHSGMIDLSPYLIEAIVLELPYVYVCKEDCLGLCPTCGTNRNEKQCECKNERIDPRLADLALFFEKSKSDNK